MVEIYWLQRIGALSSFFEIMWISALVVVGLIIILFPILYDFAKENNMLGKGKFKKGFITLSVVFCVCVVGDIFTPSTKEMYAIYGLGGTIDYIKSNDKAKELPDKVVDALTRYVDSIEKENGEENNTNQ